MAGQEHTVERRLAAILAADVVGSSRLMELDEAGTLAAIRVLLSEVIEPIASRHRGRIVKTLGDGALLEFASPVEAVRSAVEIQILLGEQRHQQPVWQGIDLRIGVNLGDTVISPDGDIHGDSVNIAARLEGIADAGGICISDKVFAELEGKLALPFEDRGEQRLKNISTANSSVRAEGRCHIHSAAEGCPTKPEPSRQGVRSRSPLHQPQWRPGAGVSG